VKICCKPIRNNDDFSQNKHSSTRAFYSASCLQFSCIVQ
jgi:hypothetical protein